MEKGNRYRLFVVISYILLIIIALILLAGLWNNLSLNPNVRIGNGLYFLVFLILILATIIFVLHILEERKVNQFRDIDKKQKSESVNLLPEESPDPVATPFEVDIDSIARNIIPGIDPKESLIDYTESILLNLAKYFEIVQGIIYLRNSKTKEFDSISTYAYTSDKNPESFKEGDGLVGQAAKNKLILNLGSIPEGYMEVQSGLGRSSPDNLVIIPLLMHKETIGIIELASFYPVDEKTEWTLMNLSKIIGNSIVNKIKSTEKK